MRHLIVLSLVCFAAVIEATEPLVTGDAYKTLAARVQQELDQLLAGPVIFMAKQLSNLSPVGDETLVFTQVDTNVGDGYDNNTGVFTAPVSGTYTFHVQFCTYYHKIAVVALSVNGVSKTMLYTYGDGAHACRILSYPALLNQGDTVEAKVDPSSNSGQILASGKTKLSTFSGALQR